MNALSGVEGAKKFLLHSDWYGYIDLTNPARKKIFMDYLHGKK